MVRIAGHARRDRSTRFHAQAYFSVLAATAHAAQLDEGLFEFLETRVGDQGLDHPCARRSGGLAFTAAPERTRIGLADGGQDITVFQCLNENELAVITIRRSHNGRFRQIVEIPCRDDGAVLVVTRTGADKRKHRVSVGGHSDVCNGWKPGQVFNGNRLGGD